VNKEKQAGIEQSVPAAFLFTSDPYIMIEEQRKGYVRYQNITTGRRWEVFGTCAWDDPLTWGPCGEGSVDPPIGSPENRLDNPVTPEMKCSLCIDQKFLYCHELFGTDR